MFKYYGKIAPYLFLLPAGIVLLIFFFIPFFQTIGLSFLDYSHSIYNPVFTGIKNYIEILHNPVFYKVMWNTILYLVVAVPILAIFPLFLAVLINQKIRGITLYKILIGYYMMIYLASLMSVPKELYEACDIDGANFWQKHLTVTVPHLMPTIALVSTISSISAMKIFAEIYVMTKGGPLDSTKTIVYYIYEKAFENLDLGYASAMAVILLVIVMIFSLINIFCFERGKYKI